MDGLAPFVPPTCHVTWSSHFTIPEAQFIGQSKELHAYSVEYVRKHKKQLAQPAWAAGCRIVGFLLSFTSV